LAEERQVGSERLVFRNFLKGKVAGLQARLAGIEGEIAGLVVEITD
jgi:hypothetical protein